MFLLKGSLILARKFGQMESHKNMGETGKDGQRREGGGGAEGWPGRGRTREMDREGWTGKVARKGKSKLSETQSLGKGQPKDLGR